MWLEIEIDFCQIGVWMTTRMIIAEVSLSSFLLDVQTNENILSHCDVVHLTSGLIDGDDLHKVLYFLGHTKENQNIKLCQSLNILYRLDYKSFLGRKYHKVEM